MSTEWWQTYFSGMSLEVWRHSHTEDQTRAEAELAVKLLGLAPGARVLDVPCGEGRIALELAARGCQVTGIDLSPDFLAGARGRSAERGLAVEWEQRDMRELPWESRFDAVLCLGSSFGYFARDAENAAFVQAVARSLRPGGRFLLGTHHVLESLMPNFRKRAWAPFGDIHLLFDNTYDPASGRLGIDFTMIRGGELERHTLSIRQYTYRELRALCEASGLVDVVGYGSARLEPFQLGSPFLYLAATKPGA